MSLVLEQTKTISPQLEREFNLSQLPLHLIQFFKDLAEAKTQYCEDCGEYVDGNCGEQGCKQ
jgi:hypothetical protein